MIKTWASPNVVAACGQYLGCFTGPRTSFPGGYQGSVERAAYAAAHGGAWPRGGGGVLW
jgi:hypothetical protein